MVDAATPDALIAPQAMEMDALVRDSFRLTETEGPIDIRSSWDAPPGNELVPDPWSPQITWKVASGKAYGLHLPLWKVTQALPVDLCFEVEIHDVKTGEVFPGDPIVVRRGQTRAGYFSLRPEPEFAGSRSGFVPIKIVLKASRAIALTYPEITRYYPGSITSEVLRAKVDNE